MQPHQQRVVEELKELEDKTAKLVKFMYTDLYAGLPATEQGLLMVQLVAMENYTNALNRRIEGF